MPVTADAPAPYASPSTIIGLIKRYRDRGLQTPFSGEVLERAGVGPSLVSRTMAALETLDLIDSEGNPTASLEALGTAPEAEYQQQLSQVIRSAYEDVFRFVDPSEDGVTKVQDAFRAYTPRGQMSRMVTLFLGLCHEAGIVEEMPKRPGRKPGSKAKPKKSKPTSKDPSAEKGAGGSNHATSFFQGTFGPSPKNTDPSEGKRVQFQLPVPGKADCIVSLPEEIDGDDWDMLKIQLDAYVQRLMAQKGGQQ